MAIYCHLIRQSLSMNCPSCLWIVSQGLWIAGKINRIWNYYSSYKLLSHFLNFTNLQKNMMFFKFLKFTLTFCGYLLVKPHNLVYILVFCKKILILNTFLNIRAISFLRDCKHYFNLLHMQRWQFPIHNDTLKSFGFQSNKISNFIISNYLFLKYGFSTRLAHFYCRKT